jgi:hypothetical protein
LRNQNIQHNLQEKKKKVMMTQQATAVAILVIVVVTLLVVPAHGGAYVLDWEAKGFAFFDKFDFISDDDPTNGFVNYVNQSYAQGTPSPPPLSERAELSHAWSCTCVGTRPCSQGLDQGGIRWQGEAEHRYDQRGGRRLARS